MAERTCGVCGNELPPQKRGRPRKYCPGRCARSAYRAGQVANRVGRSFNGSAETPCGFCGVPQRRGRFCSTKCQDRHKAGTNPAPKCRRCDRPIPVGLKQHCATCKPVRHRIVGARTCRRCGKWFWLRTDSRNRRLCSLSCSGPPQCPIMSVEAPIGPCLWCGKRCPYGHGRRFCSDTCRAFQAWYRDKKRALSWRILYLHCPNPNCDGVKVVRPSRAPRATCNNECEEAWRTHQMNGGHSPNVGKSGGWISRARRLAIYERDHWVCQLCHRPVDPDIPGGLPDSHSLDHIIPRSLGGGNDDGNLQLAHHACNTEKGIQALGSQLRLTV